MRAAEDPNSGCRATGTGPSAGGRQVLEDPGRPAGVPEHDRAREPSVADARDGRLTGPVVFWHAGGTPGIFEDLPPAR